MRLIHWQLLEKIYQALELLAASLTLVSALAPGKGNDPVSMSQTTF